jgi:hypothetical protein
MKTFNLDEIKREFEDIAELIVSLDNDNKAILKSRGEIRNYINNKPLLLQSHAVEQLIDMLKYGIISNFNLNPIQKKGLDKFPFGGFCQYLSDGIKSDLDHNEDIENKKDIEKIKIKLNSLENKQLKINYLLNFKREWEGDYFDEGEEEILKQDKVYSFIIRELKFLERSYEIPIKETAKVPQPLQTNLTTEQGAKLFDELVNGGFIPKENKDCFNWAIGVIDETEPKQPGEWKPIKWKKKKNLAVYLIDQLCFNDQLTIQENYFSIGTLIFNVKNMSQIKNGYKNNDIGKPIDHKLIDDIISKIREAK